MKVKQGDGSFLQITPKVEVSDIEGLESALNDKVSVVEGKTLSTNDFTNEDKTKLDNLGVEIKVFTLEDIL